ncbi:unnamed protein product [marine sediment metagenome]|uniref:Uncharacterized protein n=1 Tax=marine sediment metagenome TaxID=412755 RepID=X1ISW2_9ZZZZ
MKVKLSLESQLCSKWSKGPVVLYLDTLRGAGVPGGHGQGSELL